MADIRNHALPKRKRVVVPLRGFRRCSLTPPHHEHDEGDEAVGSTFAQRRPCIFVSFSVGIFDEFDNLKEDEVKETHELKATYTIVNNNNMFLSLQVSQ